MKSLASSILPWAWLALACFACGEEKRDPTQWPIAKKELEQSAAPEDTAELTYKRYCIGCHGSDGRGNGGSTGADLTTADGPLTQRSDAELASAVRDGKRGKTATMPPHKPVLDEAQIAAVIRYVRARFQPEAPTEPRANEAEGEPPQHAR